MAKVILTTFTDPMMGLSYECEPIFRKLETHFDGMIEFRYVMAGLVRDVTDFMTAAEREETVRNPESGILAYCRRLANIYRGEEAITGMPIRMEGFHLFDAEHRSSYPLDIAYEAAKLAAPEKAERFLYRLRYATIVETRQTTRTEELLRVAELAGIDAASFKEVLENGSAEAAFRDDLEMTAKQGIHSLPAFLLQYGNDSVLIPSLIGYDGFASAIRELTKGEIKPAVPILSESSVEELVMRRKLVSLLELWEAFDQTETGTIVEILDKLQRQKKICIYSEIRNLLFYHYSV